MATRVAFKAALIRCGINEAAADLIQQHGIGDAEDLSLLNWKDISETLKQIRKPPPTPFDEQGRQRPPVVIPATAEVKLCGMHMWLRSRQRRDLAINIGSFNNDLIMEWARKARDHKEQQEAESSTGELLKTPAPLKVTDVWTLYRKEVENYLSTRKNMEGIPMDYVVRKQDAPLTLEELPPEASSHDKKTKTVALSGPAWEEDNGTVFALIKQLTLKSHVWSFISQYEATRNGRAAFQTLDQHFQGDARIGRSKQEAYEAIAAASYKGETRNWGYELYLQVHADNHRILQEAGEPVPEQKKVRDFLEGINSPDLTAGKAYVKASTQMINDFTACADYLASFIRKKVAASGERRVASVGGGGGAQGDGVGVKPRARKGGGARGRKQQKKKVIVLAAKNYSAEDWAALTPAQQVEVNRLRRLKKRTAAAASTAAGSAKRSNSSLDTEDNSVEEVSASAASAALGRK